MAEIVRQTVHSIYARYLRPHLTPIWQQRTKLLWTVWGYYPLLTLTALPTGQRLELIRRMLRVDWFVQHGHWPGEIANVLKAVAEKRAGDKEVVVEAGCWQGGSTAKLSIICRILGYRLIVFDSFEGVEWQPNNTFSGQYAATLEGVVANVTRHGEVSVCRFVRGWFADTLAKHPVVAPIWAVYIDCDLAKGTREVLQGVLPSLVPGGSLCSQDYHIKEVRAVLDDGDTWANLGAEIPVIEKRYRNLVVLRTTDLPIRLRF